MIGNGEILEKAFRSILSDQNLIKQKMRRQNSVISKTENWDEKKAISQLYRLLSLQ